MFIQRLLLAALFLTGCFTDIRGQHELPLTISVFNESTSMPYTTLWSEPLHPGIQIGTEFRGDPQRRFAFFPTVSVGYMFHRDLFHGLFASVDASFEYRHPSGVNLKAKLGGGYLKTFATRTEYTMVGGELVPKKDEGNSRVMPSLTFGLGYRLRPKEARSPEIFLLHQTWLEYPYAGDFIPLMSHTNLHFGVSLYPFTPKSIQ